MKKIILILLIIFLNSCSPQYDYLKTTKDINLSDRVQRLFNHLEYQPKTQYEAFLFFNQYVENNIYVFSGYQKNYPEWLLIYFNQTNIELHKKNPRKVFISFLDMVKHDNNFLKYR